MTVPIIKAESEEGSAILASFLDRPAFEENADRVARSALSAIREKGMEAVLDFIREYDKVDVSASNLRVTAKEIAVARDVVDDPFRTAVRDAHDRIAAFAQAGLKKDWNMASPGGGTIGEKFVPLDRVGVYVPGGTAPLVSTALMTATLASVAGVKDIVVCTPCSPDMTINPFMLYAIEYAGATEIYRVGGIQAIGLMAYGVKNIPRVQKIVGPGNAYVTAAKRQVYGDVSLDLVAGPSEIAILADDSANPDFVAADLLSQAEHGSGLERALLVTPSEELAEAVRSSLASQAPLLSRHDTIQAVMSKGMIIAVTETLDSGMDLCNRFAPEHLEILTKNPETWLDKARHAGAVFLGPWTPEAVGDFAAGPSHVLPTGGAAARFSGLTVDDFRKRTSYIAFSRDDLEKALPTVSTFGRVEGLDAHSRSAEIRFE